MDEINIRQKMITFFSEMSENEVGNSENSYEMKIGQG